MKRMLILLLLFAPCLAAQEIRVGSKPFPEGRILGEIITLTAQLSGAEAVHKTNLSGTGVVWNALKNGEIDVYAEYTGTLQGDLYSTEAPPDFDATLKLMERDGVVVIARLGFNNTYAIGMKEEVAERLGITRISDLGAHPELKLGFSNEFTKRPDCWPGVKQHYGLPQTDVSGMQHELAYEALDAGTIHATDLYSTDATIEEMNLRILEDDRGFFPDYRAVIIARKEVLEDFPGAVAAWRRLEGAIGEAQMVAMNASVVVDKNSEGDVAADFLQRLELDEEPSAEDIRAMGKRTLGERVSDAMGVLPRMTGEHLAMVLLSLLAGAVVAIPLGVVAQRRPRLGQVILGGAGVLQTIPSIALLVLLIPLLGIGWWPAVVALFLYSLLPIVRNTHAGLKGIDPELIESADALGLDRGSRLRLIELPLSARSIMAGLKIAAVINVGTATLGGFIGAGGYGEAIFTGISRQDNVQILSGAIPAALLALLMQGVFEVAERLVVPRGLRLSRETL